MGQGHVSVRAVKVPCRRRSLQTFADGGRREVEMLSLLDTPCSTKFMGLG